jgi:pimeloyl-ACP methyl ester carboxylesterase
VALPPAWSIIRSRFWKLQVPFLACHHRVVTFHSRGTGCASADRCRHYTRPESAADTLAMLGSTGTDRAVLVGLPAGALWGVEVAAECPDRVLGLVPSAAVPLAPQPPERRRAPLRGAARPD